MSDDQIEGMKKEIEKLRRDLENERSEKNRIIEEKDKILEEKDKILEEKDRILREKKRIEKEYEEFRAKHAVTVSNLRAALKIKPILQREHKPLGARKGHAAYTRRIPERIDRIVALIPKRCPHCRTVLRGKTQEVRSRHVTDIRLVPESKTTRYDIHRLYCPTCKKLVELEVKGALPRARFGLNVMLLVMYLRLGLRLPCNKIREYFQTAHGILISEGEIIGILKQLVLAYGPYYSHIEKLVKQASVKYSDTTSWRINGKNYFAWVFITYGSVIYKIRKHNNHKVALAFLGKQKGNTLVVDRHSAYRPLATKAGFLLQLCWSHILQDSKDLAANFGKEGKHVHKKLKEVYELATGLEHAGTPEMVEQLKAEILLLTQRHYTHTTVQRFVKNLYFRDVNNLFRFVTDPSIDPTNNISERLLRILVIIRKISNGSRSTRGAHATAMLLSVLQTLRLNHINPLQGLRNILKNPSGY